MANIILCVGSVEDPHILSVDKHIRALDSEARIVLFNPLCAGHFIEITTGNVSQETPSCTVVVGDERISAKSIRSVWYRWKPAALSAKEDFQGLIAQDFALNEWKSVVRSLESFFPDVPWLNPLGPLDLIKCKPYQLWLAQQVGLTVPRTTITNNPAAAQRIFDEVEHGRVIFKSLTPLFIPPDKLLYTTEISREFPSQARSSVMQCPAIYQELVQRRSDLRITIVGCEVFAVRIASQKLEREKDRLDWRRCQDNNDLYSKAEVKLPQCILFYRLFAARYISFVYDLNPGGVGIVAYLR